MPKHYKQFSLQTVFTLLLLLAVSAMSQAAIRYVKQGGSGNGSSWAAASGDLQAMITASSSGDEVWVAAGTYKPAAYPTGCTECTTNRDWAFLLKDGVKVYGGFAATGNPTFAQRNVATNITILSGDIGTADNASDNTYHVVVSSNDGPTTLIDGFTIRDGNANYVYAYPSPLSYIVFEGNYFYRISAGGLYLNMSTTTVSNITFTNNSAEYGAGLSAELDNAYTTVPVVGKANTAPAKKDKKAAKNALKMEQKQVQQADKTFYSQMREVAMQSKRAGSDAFSMAKPPKQERLNVTKPTQHLSVMDVGLNITDCKFLNNTAINDGYGGGLYMEYATNASVKNCYFYQNITDGGSGGAFYDDESEGTVIDNCTFEENEATNGGDSGAGLAYYSIGIVIKNSTFKNNKVYDSYGGAIYDYYCESIIIDNCKFDGNGEAEDGGDTDGGAIYSYAYDEFSCEVKNSTFENNVAYYGGAIYVSEYSMKISNCVFKKNTAYAGGAVYAYYGGVFDRCTFIENTATGEDSYGGALYFDDEPSIVSNCLFVKNSADYGGGIYDEDYEVPVTNCTFVGNISREDGGGGIYNYGGEMAITNSIFWGNTGTGDPNENQVYDDGTTSVKNCNIQDGIPSGSDDDGGNLSVDPLFVNAANDNYRLQSGSPAKDAGDNSASITSIDLDGNPRIVGIIDMGAYESLGIIVASFEPICLVGNPLKLSTDIPADGGNKYAWKGPNGFTSKSAMPIKAKTVAKDEGIYSVTATLTSGATNTGTIRVYFGVGTLTATSNSTVCRGGTIQLSASAEFGASYKWTKQFSSLTYQGQNPTIPNAQPSNGGVYIVFVTGQNGCIVKKEVLVTVSQRACSGGRLASGEEEEEINMEVNTYPNPTSKMLTVEVTLKEPSALKLQLYNATGQALSNWDLSEETTTHRKQIDMSVYKDGLYLIQAESKDGKQTKRVMKVE